MMLWQIPEIGLRLPTHPLVKDDDDSPKAWMKKLITDGINDKTPNEFETDVFKRRQRQKLEAYQELYIEYESIFKKTNKRHHASILSSLYDFQVKKALRSLIIIPRAGPKKMKRTKLLWLQYSSLPNRNVNNDLDISESKNFPFFIDAYPIKDLSKSIICHRNKPMAPMSIETRITLTNGTTRVFCREFNPAYWNKEPPKAKKGGIKRKKSDESFLPDATIDEKAETTTTINGPKKLKFHHEEVQVSSV